MDASSSNDDDLVQLNTRITRGVKRRLGDAAWRRRLPVWRLVQQILEDWLDAEEGAS